MASSDPNLSIAEAASGEGDPLPFGSMAVVGQDRAARALVTADKESGSLDKRLRYGVALRRADAQGDDAWAPGDHADLMSKGRVVVPTEAEMAPGDGVYARTAASGGLDRLGGFAPAGGTGLALVENAKCVRTISAALAVIELT